MGRHWIAMVISLFAFLGVNGCGYMRPYTAQQQQMGLDGWVTQRMAYLASFYLDCPRNELERTDYGRIPRTEWYRHTYQGCGQTYEMWTVCNSRGCGYHVGLDERASVEFRCPVHQITVEGSGPYLRATGCGHTAVYRDDDGEWILTADGIREETAGGTTPVPPAPPASPPQGTPDSSPAPASSPEATPSTTAQPTAATP